MSKKNVQEILPLSPVQQGMLFHTLYEPASTAYIEQYTFPVGDVDTDAFARSVQTLVDRHGVLRTAFVWKNLRNPVQVVYKPGTVTIPIQQEDWTEYPPKDREARLTAFQRAERVRGFELTKVPTIRVALLRMETNVWWTVWTYHHLILDGWSVGLMARELYELARADAAGDTPQLPPPRPFSDFIHWYQRQEQDTARDFWHQTLAGIDEPTPLGIDRPADTAPIQAGARFQNINRRFPVAIGKAAKAFASSQRITMPTLVQAAWGLVLSRYSGRDDMVFGLTVSGRPHNLRGIQHMLGCFINTLPMRVQVARDDRVGPWLQDVQKSVRALRPFEHSPLVEVRGWAGLPADHQLFDSIVVYEGFGADTAGGGAGGAQLASRTNYALTISAMPDAESITFAIGTDRQRISDAAAVRLLDHLERAFSWIVNSPDARLGAFTLIDELPIERQSFPSPDLIQDRFARQAAATPDAVAVVYDGAQLDYQSLERAANRLAHHLRRHAVGPETLVGLLLERSLDMVVAILGVLKAGGAYLPLDPSHPDDRLAFTIDDAVAAAGLAVVVTQDSLAGRLATESPLTVVRIDADREAITGEPADPPAAAAINPDQLAYVIYTSGSTGKPKGTAITHRNVIRLFDATNPWYQFGTEDVWSMSHSYAFDVSVYEIWGALLFGGTLVVVPYFVTRNPTEMLALLAEQRVTVLSQTPTAFRSLMSADHDAVASGEIPALENLRSVIFAGEALDVMSVGPWIERLGPGGLEPVNMYGITETTVHVAYRVITDQDLKQPQVSPIGEPIPDLAVHLLDPHMHLVPVGVIGEIYVAGEGLARGYLARPALTAHRFVPDPLSVEPGARLYRSGDLARRRSDGEVEFIGRADHQVKIRGFRIELGEIETILGSHPGVRDAVVLAPTADDGERRLIAWVVGNDDQPPAADTLRQHLLAQLPDYMVPSVYMPLDALPLTANGKLDRRALPAPDLEATAQAAYVAPAGPTESLIANLWCDLLGLQRVGADDDFFALGGHSLLATSLLGRLRKVFDVEVPLRELFDAPTVKGMAERVTAIQQAGGAAVPPLVAAPNNAPKQLSFAQERLWFLDQLEPDNPWYNIPAAVRLRGQLDPAGFADALCGVLARHEVLRTNFRESDGRPVAVVTPPTPFALPVVNLEQLTDDERERTIRQRIRAEVAQTFDLEHDPLMRALLLRCAEDEHILVLTMHHIASDEWSIGVLVREVTLGYGAFLEQTRVKGDQPTASATAIAAPSIQYADFAHWQRSWLSGDTLEAQVTYWRTQLGDAPPLLELPTDRPRPRTPSYRGGTEAALLPAAVAEPLRALGRKHGATTFMTLLAAFAVVLGRYAGQQDVVIGTPTANRGRIELEPLIGFFVNTLALRIRFDDDPTFPELLARARKTLLAAHAAQDLPFEQLMQTLDPERSLSHAPIFQVMLVMQNAQPEAAPLSDLEVEALPASAGSSKFDLTLNVSDTGDGGLVTRLIYASDLFTATTAQRMLTHLHTLLTEVSSAPDRPVSMIPLLGTEERQSILTTWSRPREDLETVATLHTLVEQQVTRTPDAIAVLHEAGSMAYSQLEHEANQLAHHLLERGAGPDAVVGIALERSPELVVGILAILKTGAGYLPLDPSLPPDRLAFMIADTQTSLVVTSSSLSALLPAGNTRLVQVDQVAEAIAQHPETAPQISVDTANIAYIIFTSGSTGQPKGVAVPHGAVANRMKWVQQVDLDAPPRFLQKSSIGFDVSVAEIFAPLVAGGCCVLPKPGGTQDTSYLLDLIARTEVTHTSFPPSLLAVLLEEPTFVARATSLRSVIVGGEAVPPDLPGRFYPKLPHAVLENRYGPTEATISVTTWPCPHDPEGGAEPILPIGLPISQAEVYLVDRHGEPVPAGTPGEIWIGGGCLARGYLGRPALTASTFIPHPFSELPGQRLYRTGDLGRWRDDGALLFVGRADQQVKIRGFRIELGEIEATLALQSGIGPNAVVVRGESNKDQRLVAFWVPEPETDDRPSRERLHEALAQTLPNYMVPSVFVELDALPVTPSGKVDRAALGRLTLPETDHREAPPLSPIEALVADLWCDALNVSSVHPQDDFFALGGHSLLASVLLARLRNLFDIEIPLRDLFEASTLHGMAQRVEAAQRAGEGVQTPPLVAAPADAPMTLSFAQERLWFLDQLEPGNPWYNIPAAVRLRGDLNPEGFAVALTEVVTRHQVLRTRFGETNGSPRPVVDPPAPFDLPLIDLSDLVGDERETAVQHNIGTESAKPFDLARGPLLRATLLRCSPTEHILIVTMHHIVSDEWSAGILVREIALGYDAHVEGRSSSSLPPLPIQYADFAHWQRGWLQGDVLDEQVAYWRDQLAGAPAMLELPTDRPRPKTASYRGGTDKALIPASVAEPLRALGRVHGATMFMTTLAALAVVLGRYAGQQDVVIGSPIASRSRVELEPLIGFFVNTLALRIRFDDDPTFPELLARARKTLLGAHAAQDLPFEQLVQALDPERSLSHAPIFQVMLLMQNTQTQASPLSSLDAESLPASAGTANFDLTVTISDPGQGDLFTQINYSADLFEAKSARRMHDQLHHFLTEVAAAPDRPVTMIPLVDPDVQALIQAERWRSSAAPYDQARSITARMDEATIRASEGNIAATFQDQTLNYGQLTDASRRLARHLRDLGVGPEVRVGICLERGLDLLIATLGVMRAGGTYVPLDPDYPTARIRHLLDDAAVGALITQEALVPALPTLTPEVAIVLMDRDRPKIDSLTAKPLAGGADPANLAYVIYTSGSTGKPKGVQIPHRALVNFLESMTHAPGLTSSDTLVAVTTLAFDIAGLELYLPLLVGGRVVIADRETALDGQRLGRLLEKSGATIMQATPATWRLLLDSGWQGQRGLKMLCGGEALPRELADRLLALDLELWNLYGPTETTIWSTTAQVAALPGAVSIGQAIANTQVHIVDHSGRAVATGVAGELLIGGDGLARGYAGRPALTAERFIPDAFTGRPGRRVYRTGDLARRRNEGDIDYIGRADQQVKIRGYRIELGEIESVLALEPAVGNVAVVVVRAESAGDQRLVAYWVPEPETDSPLARTALRDAVSQTLPNYMVPSAFVELDALPLTPNGKVDRGALARRPLADTDTVAAENGADDLPLSPTEALIADLWCQILGRSNVAGDDDFFALGGHSLLATSLAARLRTVFEVEMPLRDLFEASTLRGMAHRVEEAQQTGGGPQAPPLGPAPADAPTRLSFAQERMWFLDQLQPDNPWYNIPAAVRLRGDLDPEGFAQALGEVVARHQVLRTRFRETNGIPVAVVDRPGPFDLPLVDLSEQASDDREAAVQRRIAIESATPFDLARGPLLRALLLRCAADEHILIVVMHHIVSDEWSAGVLVRELALCYDAHLKGHPSSSLPALPIQYPDFAHWQRSWLRGDVFASQVAFWREQLDGAPPMLELATDRPRPQTASYRGGSEKALLPAAVAEPLRALGQAHGATVFMTALAAFAVVLGRYAGQRDVVIGSPFANRGRVELESLIGFFVNTLALRVQFDDDPTFPELLARARKTLLGAHANQDLPFEQLVQALDPERSLGHAPIFQVMLAMQNAQPKATPLSGLEAEALSASPGTSKFDLTLTVSDAGDDGLMTQLVYATDLFTATTVRRILIHFHNFLREVTNAPDRPVTSIPLLGVDERQQLLSTWSCPRRDFETVTTLHTLVEHQVQRTPDATAVWHEAGALSYHQLENEANRLAHHLLGLGAGPDAVIGIALDPSPDLVVGVLAILKTGAAYLPLDPAYPEDRLTFMLADTQASLVVTSSSVAEHFPAGTTLLIDVDRDAELIARHPETAPAMVVDAANIAYVIYTSGSTGQPKGVAVPHGAVANRMQWVREIDLDVPPRFLQKSSICFDVSVAEIFAPLVAGGCCVVPKPGGTKDPGYLLDLIAQAEVTHTSFPPSLLGVLLEQPSFVARAATLRSVVVGGEAVPPDLPARFYAKLPNAVLENRYGPTEATISVTTWPCPRDPESLAEPTLPIGLPISKAEVYLVDEHGEPVPVGAPGEIMIGGGCLARGYLGRPALNAAAFIPHPFSAKPGQRLYRTGDLGRWRHDGALLFVGRVDQQVKIRGFRIELGEIESVLAAEPSIKETSIVAHEVEGPASTDRRLAAFVVGNAGAPAPASVLRDFLRDRLPYYMMPSRFETLESLPLTTSGKVDRTALLERLENQPTPSTGAGDARPTPPSSTLERAIATVWQEVLDIDEISADDSFFDLGGHSLLLTQVQARLRDDFDLDLSMMDLFKYPTIRALARHLDTFTPAADHRDAGKIDAKTRVAARRRDREKTDIAIIAMNGRFPGASNVDELWRNIHRGADAVTFHSPEALREAGVTEAELAHPNFVPASMVLKDIDLFDAKFFDYAPREAQIIDPQQRLFLEISWEAIEQAGYDTARYQDRIAVFGGVGSNAYQLNLFSEPGLLQSVGLFQIMLSNERDFLPTRVSYKLGLRGPSVNVQCACSTSLVAVALACDSLVEHRSDMALAGGVTIQATAMSPSGYIFEEGGIQSHDGHTRAFGARSTGSLGSSGAGVVLLKRLQEAQNDGDPIHAVIKGWAVNNDGADKIGWTAPGVSGQVEVIREALEDANVKPETIGYVEAHGTATALGDPIEVEALNLAYELADASASCAIGSIKNNVGHLGAAAGVAGLIKAVLALEHRAIPPSPHHDSLNPKVPFADGPFFVNTTLRRWQANGQPRRAAVTALGIGGTNAHLVLQEAPATLEPETSDEGRTPATNIKEEQLLLLSAKTRSALDTATANLARHLGSHPDLDLADVAFTLQVGRRVMPYRRALLARDHAEAIARLERPDEAGVMSAKQTSVNRPVVFLFPGGDVQHRRLGVDLYHSDSTYRHEIDRCAALFEHRMGFDLRVTLLAENGPEAEQADARPRRTSFALPTLFATEYALGRLLIDRGIVPRAMIGHGLGEYTAAAISGVLSLADATRLVAARADLLESLPHGTMLSVNLAVDELMPMLGGDLAIAAVNTPTLCVASGPVAAIETLAARLVAEGVEHSSLPIDAAAHSPMAEPILDPFEAEAQHVEAGQPAIPYVSNVTGTWITANDLSAPDYWPRHLRSTVRFAEGLEELLARDEDVVLLEVGPGESLSTFARQHPACPRSTPVRTTMRHPREVRTDTAFLRQTLGRLWLDGVHIDWFRGVARGSRRRVALPTYPFERKRHWIGATSFRRPTEATKSPMPVAAPAAITGTRETAAPHEDDNREAYVTPRDDTERQIAALWEELLGVERVGIHDNFFELGGSSLMAVRLGTRLRAHFETKLSPQFLLEAPTVARLAAQLAARDDPNASAGGGGLSPILVPMNTSQSPETPLVMVHPFGGHVYFYLEIAQALGHRLPVIAIRARGLEEGETPFNDLRAMAAHYVEQLRATQPAGPYRLGGSSMGGLVAYEMAQQLVRSGEEVELLALLDTAISPADSDRVIDDNAVIAQLIGRRIEDGDAEAQLEAIMKIAHTAGELPEGLAAQELIRLGRHHFEAAAGYRPEPYPGRLTFFRARDRKESDPPRPEAQWIELATGGVEVHVVPGDHIGMHFPPNLLVLVDRLRQAIDRLGDSRHR